MFNAIRVWLGTACLRRALAATTVAKKLLEKGGLTPSVILSISEQIKKIDKWNRLSDWIGGEPLKQAIKDGMRYLGDGDADRRADEGKDSRDSQRDPFLN